MEIIAFSLTNILNKKCIYLPPKPEKDDFLKLNNDMTVVVS